MVDGIAMRNIFSECQIFSGCLVTLSLAFWPPEDLYIYISITSRVPTIGLEAKFQSAKVPECQIIVWPSELLE